MDREESPMPTAPANLLGKLVHCRRKTGEDIQSYPIDAERITIGRSDDADIRLYFGDVSKLHAEVVFDLLTSQASLHVLGANGLDHASHGGAFTKYHPPSIIPLADKDTFILRKKVFRFEYIAEQVSSMSTFDSPVVPMRTLAPSPAKPTEAAPRRASHRLSLVPTGKTFVPLSPAPRRMSAIRDDTIHGMPLEEEVDEGSVIDETNGDEGDVVYLEIKDIEAVQASPVKAIQPNPFLTPQVNRKAAPRNTSAVPRTRKLPPSEPMEAPQHIEEAAPPKTPRSVPLPASAQTPYSPRVPANVAMSTPKGPFTLHKALLVKSARKVWHETRSPGIDGAVESGNVETRRKSLTPTAPRKSLGSPVAPPAAASDDEEEEEEQVNAAPGELQWVYENGQPDVSLDESDSDMDSLEADCSLDIPGEMIMDLETPASALATAEFGAGHQGEVDDEDEEEEDVQSGEEADVSYEEEAINEPEEPKHTPLAARLFGRFFTPQAQRNSAPVRPTTLAKLGGGPARRVVDPSTPVSHASAPAAPMTLPAGTRFAPTPGGLGKPARRVVVQDPAEEEEEEALHEVQTPVRQVDERALAEAKKRRETLATPRNLPAAPMSGFKDPVRERAALVTPLHPVLRPTSPVAEEESPSAKTPADDIRQRLNVLRRQSLHSAKDRRATVGFTLPSTPAGRPGMSKSASYTVARPTTKFVPPPPRTPVISAVKSSSDISTMAPTPTSATPVSAPARPMTATKPAPTPKYQLKNVFNQTPARTPMAPPAVAKSAPSPNPAPPKETPVPPRATSPIAVTFNGTARPPPATPNFGGLREMFAQRKLLQTPAMNLGELYDEDPLDVLDAETEEEQEEIEVVSKPSRASKPSRVKAATTKATKAPAMPVPQSEEEEEEPIEETEPVKAKTPASRASRATKSTASTRTKIAPAEAPKPAARKARTASATQVAKVELEVTVTKKPSARGRKAPASDPVEEEHVDADQTEAEVESEPEDAPAPAPAAAPAPKARGRKPAAAPAAAPAEEEAASKPSRGGARSVSSRSAPAPAPAKAARGKKVLGESTSEQIPPADDPPAPAEKAPAPAQRKRAAPTKTTPAAPPAEKSSAPSKGRGRPKKVVEEEKENVDELAMEPLVEVKKAPAKGRATKKRVEEEAPAVAVATRATRSRK